MKFEYNHRKSKINYKKHGISLGQARELWLVPAIEIQARCIGENRSMIIGKLEGKCYSCIFTVRKGVLRLISARRSRKKEEQIYHEKVKKEN